MEVTIWRPNDMHVHLRDGRLMEQVVLATACRFGHVLVMPNTTQPIMTGRDAHRYHGEIAQRASYPAFNPLMSIKLTPETTPHIVQEARQQWKVAAGKLYPDGVTTNSEGGVRDFTRMDPVFDAMQEVGMVLCLHGEMPGAFSLDREDAFLVELKRIARAFPRLRIVLEHVSTAKAVQAVKELPATVAATITVHHLVLTLDDVLGGNLNPHAFCKPILKRPTDQKALRTAAFSGNPKFFLGTDSAPHPPEHKTWPNIKPGVFTAPVAIELLVELFMENAIDQFRKFTVLNSALFYGLSVDRNSMHPIQLERTPWTVPEICEGGIVPLYAGRKIQWKVVNA